MRIAILLAALYISLAAWGQNSTISGTVLTIQENQPIPGANVVLKDSKKGAVTKGSGAFRLGDLEAGNYEVLITCIGFESVVRQINLDRGEDEVISVRLKEDIQQLPSVEISGITLTGGQSGKFDLPGAGFYLSPQELETYKNFDVNHSLKQVPGVYFQEEDGFGLRPNVGMRGTGSERSQKLTLMEDGVLAAPAPYAAPSAYYFPTFGRMHAVEILKGSSQIKYGPYTTGGALNLISTPIPASMRGYINMQGGSYGTRMVHAHAGNSHKNVGYMVETFQYGSEGFKELPNDGNTGFDKQDYLAKVRFNTNPSAKVYQSLTIKGSWASETSHETYLGLTESDFADNPYQRYAASANDVMNTEHSQISARYTAQFTKNFETSITAYRNDFHRNWYKLDKVIADGEKYSIGNVLAEPGSHESALGVLQGDSSGSVLLKANNRTYYSQGIQGNVGYAFNTGDASHKLHLGIRVHEDGMDRFQHYDTYAMHNGDLLKANAGTPGTESNRIESASAVASFLQYTLKWNGLTVVPGLRYENITLGREDFGSNDPDRSGEDLKVRENQVEVWMPGIGVDYNLTEAWSLFGGVHKGFSPPNSSESTQPEESVNYELGGRVNKGALQGQLTGWMHDFSNLLGSDLSAAGGTGSTKLFNGGAVLSKGLEFSLTYDILNDPEISYRLPVTVSYTYTDARFQNKFESDFGPWGTVNEGDQLPYIPAHTFTTQISLEHQRMQLNFTGNYLSAMRTTAGQGDLDEANDATDARFTLDAAAHYNINEHFTLSASVINATNVAYIAARRPAGVRPGTPRLMRVGLTVNL